MTIITTIFVVFLEHSDPDLLVAGTKQFDQGIVGHVVETPPQIHLHFVHVEPTKNERIRSVQLQMLQIVLVPISKLELLVPNDHYYHNFVVLLEHSDPDL